MIGPANAKINDFSLSRKMTIQNMGNGYEDQKMVNFLRPPVLDNSSVHFGNILNRFLLFFLSCAVPVE